MARYLLIVALVVVLAPGCGGTRRVAANEEPVLVTGWGHKDLLGAADALATSFAKWGAAQQWDKRPVVYFHRVGNKTDQHVDTKNITDKMRVTLLKKGVVRFTASNEVQDEIVRQLRFQNGALVNPATAKQIGKQIGADYFLFGELTSITEKAGRKKGVYYKITVNLVNVETAIIEWADDAEFQKVRTRGIFGG